MTGMRIASPATSWENRCRTIEFMGVLPGCDLVPGDLGIGPAKLDRREREAHRRIPSGDLT